MRQPTYPPGWDDERVRRVLEHYDTQSDEEAVAEDEAAYEAITHTAMEVPVDLVPVARELIAKHRVRRKGIPRATEDTRTRSRTRSRRLC